MDPRTRKRVIVKRFETEKKLYNLKNDYMLEYNISRNNFKYLLFLHKKIHEIVPENIRTELVSSADIQFQRLITANKKLQQYHLKCKKK